jgi:hypothetical protein
VLFASCSRKLRVWYRQLGAWDVLSFAMLSPRAAVGATVMQQQLIGLVELRGLFPLLVL